MSAVLNRPATVAEGTRGELRRRLLTSVTCGEPVRASQPRIGGETGSPRGSFNLR
ncbi:hypothetical protein [Actinosynnema sp. ALI-1.44]|uniref:hypothetical protein n=1 Tax=Actinosynnema sp. ALI-1.44 TaxID=1933779 RepID=UPI001EDC1FF3|nr:hypothetical protein [Actinosynnema sp. ALI-1.44]